MDIINKLDHHLTILLWIALAILGPIAWRGASLLTRQRGNDEQR